MVMHYHCVRHINVHIYNRYALQYPQFISILLVQVLHCMRFWEHLRASFACLLFAVIETLVNSYGLIAQIDQFIQCSA